MTGKNIYKEKIHDFTNFLYSKFPDEENLYCELLALEDAANLSGVKIRGFYGSRYIVLNITNDSTSTECEASIDDGAARLYSVQNNVTKTRIMGEVKNPAGGVKKIKFESKFKSMLINDAKIYEKTAKGTINKNKIELKCHSKFLHRQGILSRTFLGKLNKNDIVINITDLGQTNKNKTLLTGTVIKEDIVQSFNFTALWEKGYGYIQQIEGFLLPILIYPLV